MSEPTAQTASASGREAAEAIARAAIAAADPDRAIRRWWETNGHGLHLEDYRRVVVLAMGKAGAAMAATLEELLGDRLHDGLVVTKYGHGLPLDTCRVLEAGHPTPDEAGQNAAGALLDFAAECGPDDLALCCISGGASALTPAPAEGITLEDKQRVTDLLLTSGASIHEINAVRKHLSRIKGGGLAAALAPARVVTLLISDVIGDDLSVIGSGPTAADPTTFADCVTVVQKFGLEEQLPESVMKRLRHGADSGLGETVKEGDPALEKVAHRIVATNKLSLEAAAQAARDRGYTPLVLTSRLRGEAREAAAVLASVAESCLADWVPLDPPACILAGGETTVRVTGQGKGGRNQEFVLAAALALAETPEATGRISVASVGTDGSDGPTDAAGGFATPDLALADMRAARGHLDDNDAYHWLEQRGGLIITGPTRTNVMDVALLLVEDAP